MAIDILLPLEIELKKFGIIRFEHTTKENRMKNEDILELLNEAERKIGERINERMPDDSMPDRLAIPRLNRLELEQIEVEKTFDKMRTIFNRYLV